MTHLKTANRILLSLLVLAAVPTIVFAGHFWDIDVSTPRAATNKDSVQLDFTALSTDSDDNIAIDLFRNDTHVDDATAGNGDSGRLRTDLPSDGTYTLRVEAASSAGEEDDRTIERTVTRDTVAPAEPDYLGSERSGDEYTVEFAAGDNDTSRLHVFSSTSTSFTAEEDTLEGFVEATGDSQQLTYTAPSSEERFNAVVAVDAAGNTSGAVGDPDTDVDIIEDDLPLPGTATGGGTAGTAGAFGGDGTVAGATDEDGEAGEEDGEVLAAEEDGEADEEAASEDGEDEGEVMSEDTEVGLFSLWWVLALLLIVGLGYFIYARRRRGSA